MIITQKQLDDIQLSIRTAEDLLNATGENDCEIVKECGKIREILYDVGKNNVTKPESNSIDLGEMVKNIGFNL